MLVLIDKHGLVSIAHDKPIYAYIRDVEACRDDENDDEVDEMFTDFWDTFPDTFCASTLPDLSEVISIHQQKQQ